MISNCLDEEWAARGLSVRCDFKRRAGALFAIGQNVMEGAYRNNGDGHESVPSITARTSFGNMIGVGE